MTTQPIYLLALTVPASFLGLAVLLQGALGPLKRADHAARLAVFVPTFLALATACVLVASGAGVSPTLGIGEIGLSARVDALAVVLLLLVSYIGAVVLGFSLQYLDGDPRHGYFMRRLALTLAAVTLLIIAGNLYQLVAAWIAMSLFLHGLLVFRPERPGAVLAARKKFYLARMSDGSLFAAAGLLLIEFGTASLGEIAARVTELGAGGLPPSLVLAAGLVALAAVLKTAQFPTHGWLVEVMETPTPVSALLHAGVVNAGGFLLLRFADLMLAAPAVLFAVAVIGAITAIIASAVMLTRTDQKGSLAYSTVAQMGFMMFQCGLGAFTAAAVHLVGHSLYKAYAFLSSGEAVRKVAYNQPAPGPQARGTAVGRLATLGAFAGLYCLIGFAFDSTWQSQPVIFALGMVFVIGVATFAASGIGSGDWTAALGFRVGASVVALSIAYFGVQTAAAWLLRDVVPTSVYPGAAGLTLIAIMLGLFGAFAVLQLAAPARLAGWAANLRVHVANGLYINLVTNRLLGAYRHSANSRV
jgi:NAD(P)H-quinone oxidoreductase subunit 5